MLASAIIGGISALGGLFGGHRKAREGRRMRKKAQGFIDNFEWEELQNVYDSVGVSRLGADLQREELARTTATSVDALQRGGIRGVLGGLGRVGMQNQFANRQIGADLDRQRQTIDFAQAQDQGVIRGMTERRQSDELQGYGQMLNVGMQTQNQGITDMVNAGFAGAQLLGGFRGFGGSISNLNENLKFLLYGRLRLSNGDLRFVSWDLAN